MRRPFKKETFLSLFLILLCIQGNRLASASGRDIGGLEDESVGEPGGKKHQFIAEILRWRAQATADHVLFSLLNSRGAATQTLTCSQLHKKVPGIMMRSFEEGELKNNRNEGNCRENS